MENNSQPTPPKSNNVVVIALVVIGIAVVMSSSGDDDTKDEGAVKDAPRPVAEATRAYEPPPPCDDAYLATLNEKELRRRRNEVYARKGRTFKSPDLRSYFFSKPWYQPDPNFDSSRLSLADQECIDRVQVWEEEAEHMRSLGYAY